MSPVTSDAGGVVVISQLGPHEGHGPAEGQLNAPANLPKPIVKFYQGEPEALGTTQIFTGILIMSIGILMSICHRHYLTPMIYSGMPIWTGILYISSGSLSVAASLKPTLGKVRASLVINIFSALFSVSGILVAIFDMLLNSVFSSFMYMEFCAYYRNNTQPYVYFFPMVLYNGVIGFFLILWLLISCISISTFVFACQTVCRSSFTEMHVVIYQTTSLKVSDPTRDGLDSSAALTSDLKTQT